METAFILLNSFYGILKRKDFNLETRNVCWLKKTNVLVRDKTFNQRKLLTNRT